MLITSFAEALYSNIGENEIVQLINKLIATDDEYEQARYELEIIALVLNDGQKIDFTSKNKVYVPTFKLYTIEDLEAMSYEDIVKYGKYIWKTSEFSDIYFVCDGVREVTSDSIIPGCIYYKTKELAEYAGKNFAMNYRRIMF